MIEGIRLIEIMREVVREYADRTNGAVDIAGGSDEHSRLVFLADDSQMLYIVAAITSPLNFKLSGLVILARIVGDQVVIEEDTTNKPLVDALLQQGIPREKIVLAYAGEPVPDPIEMI